MSSSCYMPSCFECQQMPASRSLSILTPGSSSMIVCTRVSQVQVSEPHLLFLWQSLRSTSPGLSEVIQHHEHAYSFLWFQIVRSDTRWHIKWTVSLIALYFFSNLLIYKLDILYDTECPCWDKVSLNNVQLNSLHIICKRHSKIQSTASHWEK